VESLPNSTPKRVVIYCRVSTEDQAERQTVQSQLDFLRQYCQLYHLTLVYEYVDDGWSGAIALGDRPEGRRLLEAARAHEFTEVLVYRLDRLGRSLKSLLDAHADLEAAGVTIRSATEPFDTSSSIGRFLFQLLGSIAELERATITERTRLGRGRAVRSGKWTTGPIPWGYDVDADRYLIPSERMVPGLAITEAELVRELFRRMAEGSTLRTEALRLAALGVPVVYRTLGGGVRPAAKEWLVGRLYRVIANPLYKGEFVMRTNNGHEVPGPMPALVSAELWEAASRAMAKNKKLSKKNAKERYLLRTLVKCTCGLSFSGTTRESGQSRRRYYRCNGQLSSHRVRPEDRCGAKMLDADALEALVWEDVREFIRNPGAVLQQVRDELTAATTSRPDTDVERRKLEQQLAGKESEKGRILTLYRREQLDLPETEHQLAIIAQETETLRGLVAALDAQDAIAKNQLQQVDEAERLAELLRDRIEQIERDDDWDTKRQLVELLVQGINVVSHGTGRGKSADLTIHYAFTHPKSAVDSAES
jgi:site-specific DNA recombinase